MNCTAKVGKLIVYKLWLVKNSMRGYTFAYPNVYAITVNANRLNGPITKQLSDYVQAVSSCTLFKRCTPKIENINRKICTKIKLV